MIPTDPRRYEKSRSDLGGSGRQLQPAGARLRGRAAPGRAGESDDDAREIFAAAGHFPDRDQEFTLGAGPVQRPQEFEDDGSAEDLLTPAARAGEGGNDDPRSIGHCSREELEGRAAALNVPGRALMSLAQLGVAVRDAMAVH